MLAESDLEPLVLADGTKIDPTTGKRVQEKKMVQVPSAREAQEIVLRAQRKASDLPAPPAQMAPVALVAFYTLYGLADKEIAIACDGKITVDQIKTIRSLDAYKDFMSQAKDNLLASEGDAVRNLIQQKSLAAANKIADLVDSENDVLSFKASQDVLDRAGHRPADIVEHKHSMENALQIVVTKKDNSLEQLPIIEADYANIS